MNPIKLLVIALFSLGLMACGSSDTNAPTVTAVSPLSGAVGVARDSVIKGTLSSALFSPSIVANSLTLSPSAIGTVALDASTKSVTLTPASNLKILTTYSATLSEDISNLTGDLMGANYNWSFTTEDGDWGTAELIETDNAGSASSPQIAFDSSGNAIAVWYQSDGTRNNIWANRFNGTSWGTAELIETDNAGDGDLAQIAFDSSNNAIAVWYQYDGTRDNIYANRFNGTSWGTAELIEADNAGNADSPQIAFDSSGNAIAVWEQSDGTRANIWANRFNGTSWGTAELLETDNAGTAYRPQIAFDSSGNAIAVWYQSDGTRNNIWANRFNGTSWGTAELLETDNAGTAYRPQIAFDSSGNAIAVWHQSDGTRNNIWANRFNGTSWGTAELIETDNAGSASSPHSAYRSQIAFDSSGNAIAVWYQRDGTRANIYANRFNGTSWGTAELIETDNADHALGSQIAFDSSGNAIAVWYQRDGTRNNIWANRFD
jgi:hypothetical protein